MEGFKDYRKVRHKSVEWILFRYDTFRFCLSKNQLYFFMKMNKEVDRCTTLPL